MRRSRGAQSLHVDLIGRKTELRNCGDQSLEIRTGRLDPYVDVLRRARSGIVVVGNASDHRDLDAVLQQQFEELSEVGVHVSPESSQPSSMTRSILASPPG